MLRYISPAVKGGGEASLAGLGLWGYSPISLLPALCVRGISCKFLPSCLPQHDSGIVTRTHPHPHPVLLLSGICHSNRESSGYRSMKDRQARAGLTQASAVLNTGVWESALERQLLQRGI